MMRRLRTAIFWLHLAAGVVAGVVVFIMSITGAALSFELQIRDWAIRDYWQTPPSETAEHLPIADLLAVAGPEVEVSAVSIRQDAESPALLRVGRRDSLYLNPYTGSHLGDGQTRVGDALRWAVQWHRWLGQEGDGRAVGKAITGACNLAFAVLIISGLYLWFPRHLRWSAFRPVLWFRGGLRGKLRDWNWHNVLGFWTAIPLLFIVLSGVVISYGWAGTLLAKITGEVDIAPVSPVVVATEIGPDDPLSGVDAALAMVRSWAGEDWREITLTLPKSAAEPLTFTVDRGNGRQPHLRGDVKIDRAEGVAMGLTPQPGFAEQSLYRKTRSIARFGHTGEIGGFWGQLVGMIVCLAAVVLVWTGLSLAIRRLWRAMPGSGKRRRTSGPFDPSLPQTAREE